MVQRRSLLLTIGTAAVLVTSTGVVAATASRRPTKLPSILARLIGTTWRAMSIAGEPVADDVTSTLTFESAVRVTGRAGCNAYFGPLSTAGGRLRMGPLGVTKMFCGWSGAMAQEARFLAALGTAERLSFEDSFLLLHSPGQGAPTRLVRVKAMNRG
jgi:heat shock protein HslJ